MKKLGLIKAMVWTKKADKMTDKERLELQQIRLRELLAYVKENSPYFSKLYKEIDVNAPLCAFPTTNKLELMAHFDEWMTELYCTTSLADAEIQNPGLNWRAGRMTF